MDKSWNGRLLSDKGDGGGEENGDDGGRGRVMVTASSVSSSLLFVSWLGCRCKRSLIFHLRSFDIIVAIFPFVVVDIMTGMSSFVGYVPFRIVVGCDCNIIITASIYSRRVIVVSSRIHK
eukprot:7930246-Ditylum_brightwellii.AAC.1